MKNNGFEEYAKALLEFKRCQREVLESTVKRIDEFGFQIDVIDSCCQHSILWAVGDKILSPRKFVTKFCLQDFLFSSPTFQWCHQHLKNDRTVGNHSKKKKLFKAFVNYQQKTLGSLSGKLVIYIHVVENWKSQQSWTFFQSLMKPSGPQTSILIRTCPALKTMKLRIR